MTRVTSRGDPVVIAVVLMVSLSACGGSYPSHDLSRRADAICADAARKLQTLAPPNFGGPTLHVGLALAAYTTSVLQIAQSEAAQLRRLPRPSQTAHQAGLLRRYLQGLDSTVDDYRALAVAQRSGNKAAAATILSSLASNQTRALAAAYGLHACSTPGMPGFRDQHPETATSAASRVLARLLRSGVPG